MAEEKEQPIMSYDAFLKERDDKLRIQAEQQKFIDSAVLTLGGGALGLLLAFVHNLAEPPGDLTLAWAAGACLVGAIVSALLSVYASQASINDHIDALDELCKAEFIPTAEVRRRLFHRTGLVSATGIFNRMAGAALVLGLMSTAGFVIKNLPSSAGGKTDEQSAVQRQEPCAHNGKKGCRVKAATTSSADRQGNSESHPWRQEVTTKNASKPPPAPPPKPADQGGRKEQGGMPKKAPPPPPPPKK